MGAAGVLSLIASAVVVGSVIVPARTLALPGASESTVVMIDPARVVDTRVDVGLDGRVVAGQAHQFLVTGPVDPYLDATSETVVKVVVPVGATGVLLNVTAVLPDGARVFGDPYRHSNWCARYSRAQLRIWCSDRERDHCWAPGHWRERRSH
jgi:hypothetical protein